MPRSMLPPEVSGIFARVRATEDLEARSRILSELRLYDLNMNLLEDARTRLSGGLPDAWQGSRQELGFPFYEVRDRVSPAWRGAVILVRADGAAEDSDGNAGSVDRGQSVDPWMVYADSHDSFHNSALDNIVGLARSGNLFPGASDYRIRRIEDDEIYDRDCKSHLLYALLDALQAAVACGKDTVVDTSDVNCPGLDLTVSVSDIPAEGWESDDAHTHTDILSLTLVLTGTNVQARQWMLKTCVPFVQPDETQHESLWVDNRMTVSLLLTRARLTQLLAEGEPQNFEPPTSPPPAPSVLHYADRSGITRAFVFGYAIRAVCGQWWVPVGDDTTHDGLPICDDCATELPVAQALKNLLQS